MTRILHRRVGSPDVWLRPLDREVTYTCGRCESGCRRCNQTTEIVRVEHGYACDRCDAWCTGDLGSDEYPCLCAECAEAMDAAEAEQIDDEIRRDMEAA